VNYDVPAAGGCVVIKALLGQSEVLISGLAVTRSRSSIVANCGGLPHFR
jgi:hypothetical protein